MANLQRSATAEEDWRREGVRLVVGGFGKERGHPAIRRLDAGATGAEHVDVEPC